MMTEWDQLLVSIPKGQVTATLILILLSWVLRRIIHRLLHTYIDDVKAYHRYRRVTTYTLFGITSLLLVVIWSDDFMSLTTFLGLVSAGIAIALKDLLTSIAAWLFIISRKPFMVGDRIQIGDLHGDVIDLRIFQFTIMEIGNWVENDQSTGRIIHVPNHKIMTDPLANYSSGFDHIWNEIKVVITFESDWKKAKEMLTQTIMEHSEHHTVGVQDKLKKASKKYMIYYKNLTPIVYMDVVDIGVQLTMRYLCKPKARRTTVDHIWSDVLARIESDSEIELAYPTQRLLVNNSN
jgi:small-conductance mechanosensitive channel